MATTVGVSTASATSASAFIGNGAGTGILDTALLAASWVFIETSTAATQGTNGDVSVWRDPTSRFVIALEPSGQFLKFRAAEAYNTANDKFNQPCSGTPSLTAQTPTANSTVTDTEAVISVLTVANMGWMNVPISPQGAQYVIDVTADRLVVATTWDLGTSSSNYRSGFAFVGHATSLFQAVGDTHPLFLGGTPGGSSAQTLNALLPGVNWQTSTATSHSGWQSSRAPGQGAVAATNPFTYTLDYPFPSYTQTTTSPTDTTYGVIGGLGGTPRIPHGFNGPIVGQGTLHAMGSAAPSGRGIFRAYTPGIVVVMATNSVVGLPAAAKAYINGDLYYHIGCVQDANTGRIGTAASSRMQAFVKAT